MARRTMLAALVAALVLIAASPAYALHKDETAISGSVTATLSYDYKKTQYGSFEFSNVKVTIDRAGQRLVDGKALGGECMECNGYPAGGAQVDSIAVRDLDADGEPEVLIDMFTGGANCCFYSLALRFDETTSTYVEDLLHPTMSFPYVLKDLNGDGAPEFRSADYRFAYQYGSNADTPRPLQIFDYERGKLIDVTIAYPKLARREANSLYRTYLTLRKQKEVNLRGLLAAYLADSYNARRGSSAWKRVVEAYRRGDLNRKIPGDTGPFGKAYLNSLRKFLSKLGYLRA
jgi:hypothetical protein